ncbi:hypothetical protein PG997_010773 [Apiospora hydei]|uniref:Azaphilone pigments biosynthesis cluster protein L N-terminal domain-containing protein n=1 Tax=Apiospora hydei TaxID=1337664 RepID=A0ABR1VH52_9PEZI
MDPLSATASVIAVAGLAVQSAKAATKVIDGLQEAPQVVVHSRALLSGTEDSLSALTAILKPTSSSNSSSTMSRYTAHSTSSVLSKRDRVNVSLHESEITQFNRQLNGCQDTITVAITTVTLLISSRTSGDIEQMSSRFTALEKTLSALVSKLSQEASNYPTLEDKMQQLQIEDDQSSRDINDALQDTCKAALKASQATRTGQTFGDMQVDKSIAMQGIVGAAQKGVEQTFGNLVAQNESREFQGHMDSNAFAAMFK